MDFVKTNAKKIGYVGALLIIIGTFLAFVKVTVSVFGYTASASSANMFDKWEGFVVLILGLISLVLLYIKKDKLVYAPATLTLLFSLIQFFGYKKDGQGLVKVTPAIGFWFILLGVVALGLVVYVEYTKIKANGGSTKDLFNLNEFTELTKKETYAPITNLVGNKAAAPQAPVNNGEFKFCTNCGTKVSSDTKFCTNCGKQL